MYAALWKALPGPAPLRALICLVLLVAVVVICFTWIFPWLAERLPVNDPSISASVTTPTIAPVR
ncbi:hypothetical protein SAMN05421595_2950 [Austwickia chelonae]|uniref:Uncharacterized protein n=1 Tax=Austwickia chelonae NBRC 105200 TaxID=1184607 RepID=K6VQT6_9MICO|nr:hypothetical protein [Austwickia chelonae]GAB79089.1 hypothetical protein AUCHE_18_00900 [Austwickia chelonae NBRC 105200]SEW42179.1 hypothetical protein SAMN05421595_2950 [Austwickia chelonae]